MNEKEAREYAESIGAIFRTASAANGEGINELFQIFLEELEKIDYIKKSQAKFRKSIHLKKNTKEKEKKCCKQIFA